MNTPRIAASSYSNTAPLVWSFLYGRNRAHVELILDNAPARSAELLASGRVDAALVPVITFQTDADLFLVPGVCVGAVENVQSVCLVTRAIDLAAVRSVALDVSSKTSVVLTKIIFREFLGLEPEWHDSKPDIPAMLENSDAALIIGDPALALSEPAATMSGFRRFDLANLWHGYTGLGFVFAMWMSRTQKAPVDFAAARDEGLEHLDEIAANCAGETGLTRDDIKKYLTENISYTIDDSMRRGMELYFDLAARHGLIGRNKVLEFASG